MTKTILITGSSRGLGATIARTLATQGHNVIINYFKSKDLAEQLVREIGESQAIALPADITDRNQVDEMIAHATEHFGQIDAVINNALVGFKFDPTKTKSIYRFKLGGLSTTTRRHVKRRFQCDSSSR